MKSIHRIVNGDSRNMSLINDKSVHLIITSPPYWQLKDYGTQDQIGYHESFESYINNLNVVWNECNRVLYPGCRLCINIGDQFARSVYYGRYKVISIKTEIIKFCETIGFDFMGTIIWQKVTTTNTTGGASIMGSFPNPRNGILKINYEYILIFKKQGDAPKPTTEQKLNSRMTTEEWNNYFSGHWNFAGARQDGHIAMFPEELPKRLIKMFSFTGETILDPFLGSGTTSLAASNLNRNSIGYEINPEFIPFISKKLHINDLINNSEYYLLNDKSKFDITSKISSLPYIFKDPHNMNKKVDPKLLQFGSRIDKHSNKSREEYFIVKEILSPIKFKLNNNLSVHLIGIRENPKINGQAIEFLNKKVLGKKVFFKYDKDKYDKDHNLLVYMYLENKTFINAHLIKNNLVLVNKNEYFKCKDKFISLSYKGDANG
jgi:site-specific DNA-methyltransferase (adenine-specific)